MKGNFQARFWNSGGRGDSPTDCRKLSEGSKSPAATAREETALGAVTGPLARLWAINEVWTVYCPREGVGSGTHATALL